MKYQSTRSNIASQLQERIYGIDLTHLIEATFEDIIQKARQIKERKFREQWITAHSATGCGEY